MVFDACDQSFVPCARFLFKWIKPCNEAVTKYQNRMDLTARKLTLLQVAHVPKYIVWRLSRFACFQFAWKQLNRRENYTVLGCLHMQLHL